MGAMTVGTNHRSRTNGVIGPKRVRRRLHAVAALLLVTRKTLLGLRRSQYHRIRRRMQAMTVCATGVIALMSAARPGKTDISLVAPRTNRILILHWGLRLRPKADNRLVRRAG